jgi:hypothetical protein
MLTAMFHIESNALHKRMSVPYESYNTMYVPTVLLLFLLIEAHCVPCEVGTENNADSLFFGG